MTTDSFEVLAHVSGLRRYARSLCRGASDVDDLVQDTLERAIRNAGRFQEGADLRVWLFAILHNAFISRARSERVRRSREADWSENGARVAPGTQEASAELRQTLAAVAGLPEDQRRVLLLVTVEGFTTDEVAEILDLPLGTVRSRLARAREALRGRLSKPDRATGFRIVGGHDVGPN